MGGVRSLVDSVGYFLPSTRTFLASKSDLGEVPFELPKRPVDAMMCANVWRGSGVGGCACVSERDSLGEAASAEVRRLGE